MDDIASWIWVLIPLAAIGVVPFKMWLRVKERQIESQSSLAAEKSAQYAQHVERIVTDHPTALSKEIDALAIDKGGHA